MKMALLIVGIIGFLFLKTDYARNEIFNLRNSSKGPFTLEWDEIRGDEIVWHKTKQYKDIENVVPDVKHMIGLNIYGLQIGMTSTSNYKLKDKNNEDLGLFKLMIGQRFF